MSRLSSSRQEARENQWRLFRVWQTVPAEEGIHKKPNDTIVFSSNPIPGNEKSVTGIINELMMKGADVIFQDVHVSGHACQEDIKLIYSLVNQSTQSLFMEVQASCGTGQNSQSSSDMIQTT